MRRSLTLAVVMAVTAPALGAGVVEAQQATRPPSNARADSDYASVIVTNPGATAPGSATSRRKVGSAPQVEPEHTMSANRVRVRPDGTPCRYTATLRSDTPFTVTDQLIDHDVATFLAAERLPTCDRAGSVLSPEAVALPFVRSIPLPVPRPHIAPDGTNITGLSAFLETNGALLHRVGPEPTELGPIEVVATGAYYVDWGDRSPEAGPFAFEGGPYPNGRITHTYRYTGTYTVTVSEVWSAQWRLGADSGTVGGLLTQASIPLEVFEIQAVRLR
ncbi:MAG: hypothetical protein ACRDIW_10520 [Actinomycetota bacterium]